MYHFMKVYISLTSVNKYWGMKKIIPKNFLTGLMHTKNKKLGIFSCVKITNPNSPLIVYAMTIPPAAC